MSESGNVVLCDVDSFAMRRDYQADFGGKHPCGTYPFASSAAGVHPDEVAAMREIDKKAGVPTDYDSDGDPIMRSRVHRKNYCRVHGLHDRNAGYSDPVPD